MNILVIPGSLREKSFNKSVARYIASISPEGINTEVFYLNNFPMFNADLEAEIPQEVSSLIDKAKEADGIIIVTPEYNNSLPAITRNMLHWLSRRYSKMYIEDKPLGIVGVSDGGFGTVRAQNELLLMAMIIGFKVSAKHKLPISKAFDLFSENSELTDERTKQKIKAFLDKYIEWVNEK